MSDTGRWTGWTNSGDRPESNSSDSREPLIPGGESSSCCDSLSLEHASRSHITNLTFSVGAFRNNNQCAFHRFTRVRRPDMDICM